MIALEEVPEGIPFTKVCVYSSPRYVLPKLLSNSAKSNGVQLITSMNASKTTNVQKDKTTETKGGILGYRGQLNEKGQREGHGIMTFSNGVYEGQWMQDKMHGKGKFEFNSGSVYEGEFKADQFNGMGSYTWKDGKSYSGNYVDGKRHGMGKQQYKNGTWYDGEWSNDKKNGKGAFAQADGDVYTGTWRSNKKDGFGILKKKGGEMIEQMWAQGKLLKEHKLGHSTDKVLENQLERITSDIKNDILFPLQEKTRVQQEQIDKLSEKLAKQKESYKKELEKSQRKVHKLTKHLKQKTEECRELREKLQQLEMQHEEETTKHLCLICCDRPVDTILLPCLHFISCNNCAKEFTRCPNCRSGISGKLHCLLQV
mmetsp:Transcript_14687/g.20474  ORF Transcript_14687/g.20474 Transcript_14687/m.20474 type:complete len:370 (+) Transcript_14687:163-1272(+)